MWIINAATEREEQAEPEALGRAQYHRFLFSGEIFTE